jgi:hypothetical protein
MPERREPQFVVYGICFDYEVFGLYATREEAEASLKAQIKQGGPAWDGCEISAFYLDGTPEVVE